MRKLFVYCCLLQFVVGGCADDSGNAVAPDEPTFDELVYQNCLLVQVAAEAYADANGDYPYFTCGELDHFLPDSTALANPRTGQRTEPVMIEPSGVGSVSYRVFCEYDADMEWNIVGYYIVGSGLYEDYVLTNIVDPEIHIEREQLVIQNVLTLIDAIDEYIGWNEGVYPVDGDYVGDSGWTLIDFLPGGELLANPYTNERTEPSIWTSQRADLPGQIAYVYYDSDGNGVRDGCRIEAVAAYAPHHICNLDKGHWLDDGFLGMGGWCPRSI